MYGYIRNPRQRDRGAEKSRAGREDREDGEDRMDDQRNVPRDLAGLCRISLLSL